jgi:hypothetical protein
MIGKDTRNEIRPKASGVLKIANSLLALCWLLLLAAFIVSGISDPAALASGIFGSMVLLLLLGFVWID